MFVGEARDFRAATLRQIAGLRLDALQRRGEHFTNPGLIQTARSG
jgi:hypothetical protein